MKDPEPNALYEDLEAAVTWIESHLQSRAQLVSRFCGPYYRGGISTMHAEVENHEFAYAALMVPRLGLDNPHCSITTGLGGSQRDVATALHAGINRWIVETQVRDPYTHVAFDMLLNWGVLLTTLERVDERGMVEGVGGDRKFGIPWRPRVAHLPPDRCAWDPNCTALPYRRWTAYKWVRDRGALLAEAKRNPRSGWDTTALEMLHPNEAVDDLNRDPLTCESQFYEDIVGWDIHVRDYTLPDSDPAWQGMSEDQKAAHNGTLFTLVMPHMQRLPTNGKRAKWVRRPRPFFGDYDGPIDVIGAYPVQGDSVPLSPNVASKAQVDELNLHARAAGNSARKFQRLVLVNETDTDLIEKLRANGDASILPVRGLQQGMVHEVTMGGLDPGQVAYIEMLLARMDRNTGMSETDRGNVDPNSTATAESLAASSAADRVSYLRGRYVDGITANLRKVARYMYTCNRIVFPLPTSAAEALGMRPRTVMGPGGQMITIPPEPWFYGGRATMGRGYTFNDLELVVAAESLRRSSEARRAQQLVDGLAALFQIAPQMPGMPWIDWDDVVKEVGERIQWPGFADLFDAELASKIGGMEMAAALREQKQGQKRQGPMGGQRGPRLAVDVGGGGGSAQTYRATAGSAKPRSATDRFANGTQRTMGVPSRPKPAAKPMGAGGKSSALVGAR